MTDCARMQAAIKLVDSPLYRHRRWGGWRGAAGRETAGDRTWHSDRRVAGHRPPRCQARRAAVAQFQGQRRAHRRENL